MTSATQLPALILLLLNFVWLIKTFEEPTSIDLTQDLVLGNITEQHGSVPICMQISLLSNDSSPWNVTLLTIKPNITRNDRSGTVTIGLQTTHNSEQYEMTVSSTQSILQKKRITLSVNQTNTLRILLPSDVKPSDVFTDALPRCVQSVAVCGTRIPCGDDNELSVRRKRQVTDANNITETSLASTSPSVTPVTEVANVTDTAGSGRLSKGALAAAIVVPILIVILAGVGGYFLYRWLRSRRTEHGVYQPKEMENQGNFSKQPDPQSVLKLPPEERLI